MRPNAIPAANTANTPAATSPIAFSLRQLQYALAVAEELSFRRAAERCHVSQPALSSQLALLEGSLGVRLFERDRRRVLVTGAGRELVERARAVLVGASDLAAAARQVADPLSGTLRIGVIPTVSPYLLPLVAPRLRSRFPHLTPRWIEDKTATLLDGLAEGRLDAVLLAVVSELDDFEQDEIAEDPFVLVAPRNHALGARSGPATLDELREAEVLLLEEGHCLRRQALEFCARADAHELAFRATSLPTLVQMVAGGAGVTLLPTLALPSELRGTRLRVRRFRAPVPGRTIALAWRRRSPLAGALREVAAVLREAYPAAT